MNKELRDKWVAALRSGEYPQTRGALRRVAPYENRLAGYCCLGVLCDVIHPGGWGSEADPYSNALGFRHTLADGMTSYGFLPHSLRVELGISIDTESTLTHLNDDGKTFAEIADFIENNVEAT